MRQRNVTMPFPWVGVGTLAVAVFAAGGLLASGISFESLLHPWSLTRAAGLVAFVLLWASVVLGLLHSTGCLKGVTSPAANVDLHQFTAVGALYATTFHAVILHWDRYVPFQWGEILLPFTSGYKPTLVGLGGVAFYVAFGATVTTYFRARLGSRAWRIVHLLTLPGFVFALLHGWLLGTDAGSPVILFLYRLAGISVVLLSAYRVLKGVYSRARSGSRG